MPISLNTLRFISVWKLLWSSIILLEKLQRQKNLLHTKTHRHALKRALLCFTVLTVVQYHFLPPLDSEWGSFLWLFQWFVELLSSLYDIILEKSSVLSHTKMQKENTILNLFDFQYDVILFQKNNIYLIFWYFQNRH